MDYKDYFFGDIVLEVVDDSPEPTTVNGITFHKGLTDSQMFDLLVALIAAEEGANIISENLRRTTLAEPYPTVPSVSVIGEPTPIPDTKQRIWVSRKYDADTSVNKTITGGRQMLELFGPGRIVETILIAGVSTIGMQIIADGDILYDGSYETLSEITKADSRLSAYYDQGLGKYIIRASDLGFQNRFVFIPTCEGTVEFSTIRVNYDLYIELP